MKIKILTDVGVYEKGDIVETNRARGSQYISSGKAEEYAGEKSGLQDGEKPVRKTKDNKKNTSAKKAENPKD